MLSVDEAETFDCVRCLVVVARFSGIVEKSLEARLSVVIECVDCVALVCVPGLLLDVRGRISPAARTLVVLDGIPGRFCCSLTGPDSLALFPSAGMTS